MIDVVIPVYEGLAETKACIDSVLKAKNQTSHHVTVINDHSPNITLTNYLRALPKSITVIENAENQGAAGVFNQGLQLSKRDVLLLNSDTIVSDYYLDKMVQVLKRHPATGIVTALTNRGTIASVPNFNQDSEIDFSVAEMNNRLARYAKHESCVIPVSVGHCMLIRRELIDKIGLFDTATYGRGYGEEMDYSIRAKAAGYKNRLAMDVFVYHHGQTSFQGAAAKLQAKNQKIINRRHPWNRLGIRLFILRPNPVKRLCNQLQQEI